MLASLVWLGAGCARGPTAHSPEIAGPTRTLRADGLSVRHRLCKADHWWIEMPRGAPLDASGLCLTPTGELLVIADDGPQIYRMELPAEGNVVRLSPFAGNPATAGPTLRRLLASGPLDCEGIAADVQGRLYVCEEARRLVLRFMPGSDEVEPLVLDGADMSKRFRHSDPNASFEGVAVGRERLYLANERNPPLLLSFDLESGRLLESWRVEPGGRGLGPLHYSDLSWRDGRLFVLLRHQRTILECDPQQRAVIARYDFGAIESDPELRYHRRYPTGVMEGLAVDANHFWVVSDNNGESRVAVRGDRRPVLLRIPRPRADLPAW